MFGGNFAPAGWAFCNGQQLAIADNETLFQLIGTTYGGDGQQTFNLPDLQGRLPMHMGTVLGETFQIGQAGGEEEVTLTTQTMPVHNHPFAATTDAGSATTPGDSTLARFAGHSAYFQGAPTAAMAPGSLTAAGGSQPHDNLQPYLCVSFIISLLGTFPTQS
jgi:microcystin-dependent protein